MDWVSMIPYLNKNDRKRSWGPFRMCLLNSTANSAQSRCKLAELSKLFTRHILNDPQELGTFFCGNDQSKDIKPPLTEKGTYTQFPTQPKFFVHCSN